jgi:folate-binding protein YgfZ
VNQPTPLQLSEFHQSIAALFTDVNGCQVVDHYGEALAEHNALRESAGVLDLSFRSRICLTGADRVRFLRGQVTNDVKRLRPGEGCYAALVTAKGKMESDLNIHCLQDELLLDFEPGMTTAVTARLEKYIVADDVQVVDVAPHYGLLSVQGPKAETVISNLHLFEQLPAKPFQSVKASDAVLGEIYLVNVARLDRKLQGAAGSALTASGLNVGNGAHGVTRPTSAVSKGFDLFVPTAALGAVMDKLIAAAREVGGRECGWWAFETARIEAGIPRFGADMDDTNIPVECGIENRAVSYNKGCYIGQEVINRIHTIGHVNRELRGLRLADGLKELPVKGDKLLKDGKEVGYVTSAAKSPALGANIALGYVRREANQVGCKLVLQSQSGESTAEIVELPFAVVAPR